MQYEEITLIVAQENYGLRSEPLDTVLQTLCSHAPTELTVLDYSSRELELTPKSSADLESADRKANR